MPKFDNITTYATTRYLRLSAHDFSPVGTNLFTRTLNGSLVYLLTATSSTALITYQAVCSFRLPRGVSITGCTIYRNSTGLGTETEKDTGELLKQTWNGTTVSTSSITGSTQFNHTNAVDAASTMNGFPITDPQLDTNTSHSNEFWYLLLYTWTHVNSATSQTGILYGAVLQYTETDLRDPT